MFEFNIGQRVIFLHILESNSCLMRGEIVARIKIEQQTPNIICGEVDVNNTYYLIRSTIPGLSPAFYRASADNIYTDLMEAATSLSDIEHSHNYLFTTDPSQFSTRNSNDS